MICTHFTLLFLTRVQVQSFPTEGTKPWRGNLHKQRPNGRVSERANQDGLGVVNMEIYSGDNSKTHRQTLNSAYEITSSY